MSLYDNIFGLGPDQASNQWEIIFPTGIPFELIDQKQISLRIDQAIELPTISVSESELVYHGSRIVRPTRSEETDKHITLQCRVDQEWNIAQALLNWREKVYNPVTTVSWNPVMIKTTIILRAYTKYADENLVRDIFNPNKEPKKDTSAMDIILTGVLLKDLQFSSFDYSSSEPLRVTMTLIFSDMIFNPNLTNAMRGFQKINNPFKGDFGGIGKTFG